MTDSLVNCPTCSKSVSAEELEPGISLVCETCAPPASGEKDPPDRNVSEADDVWHELEMRRWWSTRGRRR